MHLDYCCSVICKKTHCITPDILSLKTTRAFWRQNTFTFNKPCHLAPKYFEHFIGSAPPLLILDPLLWIGSAYVSLYINSYFGFNKGLTNLTLLRQHHLQYNCNSNSHYFKTEELENLPDF